MADAPTRQYGNAMIASIREALQLLPADGRRRLILLVLANMATAILDLLGVLFVGLLTWTLIAFVGTQESSGSTSFSLFGSTYDLDWIVSIRGLVTVGLLAAAFLIGKSVLGTYLTRRTLRYLANRQAATTVTLSERLLRGPLVEIEKRSTQETAFALLTGVNAAIVGLLGSTALAMSEVALLVLLGTVLIAVNPLMSIGAIIFFFALAYFMHRVLGSWATETGEDLSSSGFFLTQWVQETLQSFRELHVLGRLARQPSRASATMSRFAHASATSTFIGQLPKYVYETALLLGALALGAFQFATRSPSEAAATIALFIAAGTRILPAMLRLQNDVVLIKHSIGMAQPTFDLTRRFPADRSTSAISPIDPGKASNFNAAADGFDPSIYLEGVSAQYPDASEPALTDVSLRIPAGSRIALVGATGSGKSTLADILMGVLPVTAGRVLVGGLPPDEAIARWSGSIAYVPQTVSLVEGTIRENVGLGLPDNEINDAAVELALRKAHVLDELLLQRIGLDTEVGERGVRLSGGQRQRIGLARALYASPRLLVLDEATSALDARTEALVSQSLGNLDRSVTIVVVAHRLATVRNVDLVVYLDEGKVVAQGSFESVRAAVPRFAEQADLLGL